jgi:hypothetical protein
MAKDETKRVRPVIVQEDRDALAAIKGFKGESYTPANDKFTLAKLQAGQDALVAAREIEVQKQNEADEARDKTVAAEWAFHNLMLGGKDQVKAQYGDDSDEYAGMGLKKKSEHEAPKRAVSSTPTQP